MRRARTPTRRDYDNAALYADQATTYQAAADYHDDLGKHGGSMAVYDPASQVSQDAASSHNSYDSSSASSSHSE